MLIAVASGLLPLAEEAPAIDSLRRVSEGIQDFIRQQPGTTVTLLVVLVLLAGLAVLYALMRPEMARRRRAAEWVERLYHAHGLEVAQRRALRRMAARAGLDTPALLFVRRSLFDRLGQELPPGLVKDLRERLYG